MTHKCIVMSQLLEANIIKFVKNELKKIYQVLSPDDPRTFTSSRKDEGIMESEDEEHASSREALMKITVNFLRRMKKEELADQLQFSKRTWFKALPTGQIRFTNA